MASSPTERVKRYRQRKRLEKVIAEQHAALTPDVVQQTAADIQQAATVASEPQYGPDDLTDALEVGRATALLEQVLGGREDLAEQLADWIACDPPLLWLFERWAAQSPYAAEYQTWREAMGLS